MLRLGLYRVLMTVLIISEVLFLPGNSATLRRALVKDLGFRV